MPAIFAIFALVIGYMMSGNYHPSQTATISHTPTPTVASAKAGTNTPTPTFTPTPKSTDTPTPTRKPTTTPTVTPSLTNTPTPTGVRTPSPTPKPTAKVFYASPPPITVPVVQSGGGFACDCTKTCPNMSSCAEAQYQLNTCGCTARDTDHDGIACDAQCQ